MLNFCFKFQLSNSFFTPLEVEPSLFKLFISSTRNQDWAPKIFSLPTEKPETTRKEKKKLLSSGERAFYWCLFGCSMSIACEAVSCVGGRTEKEYCTQDDAFQSRKAFFDFISISSPSLTISSVLAVAKGPNDERSREFSHDDDNNNKKQASNPVNNGFHTTMMR